MPTWFAVNLASASIGVHGSSAANVISGGLVVNPTFDPDGDGVALVDAPNEREAIRAAFAGAVVVSFGGSPANQTYEYLNPSTVGLSPEEHKPYLIDLTPYAVAPTGTGSMGWNPNNPPQMYSYCRTRRYFRTGGSRTSTPGRRTSTRPRNPSRRRARHHPRPACRRRRSPTPVRRRRGGSTWKT